MREHQGVETTQTENNHTEIDSSNGVYSKKNKCSYWRYFDLIKHNEEEKSNNGTNN